jgi:hypothetical protein
MRTPASVWQPSIRAYNPEPPSWDYGPGADLRKVNRDGDISIGNRPWVLSRVLALETVELKQVDQKVLVYFCRSLVREIDLAAQRSTAVDRWANLPNM